MLVVLRIDEVELRHELAAVADAETHSIWTFVEILKSGAGLLVVEERSRPAFRRTENVGVAETANKHYHIHVAEVFAPAYEVCHVYILDIEAGSVESVSHLTVTLAAFLTDDSRLHARRSSTVHVNAQILGFAGEAAKIKLKCLILIVLITLQGFLFATLSSVEEI